jgi:hypothetical protein
LPILVTLMMETLCSSEMSVLTSGTWHNIPQDGILDNFSFFNYYCKNKPHHNNVILCINQLH